MNDAYYCFGEQRIGLTKVVNDRIVSVQNLDFLEKFNQNTDFLIQNTTYSKDLSAYVNVSSDNQGYFEEIFNVENVNSIRPVYLDPEENRLSLSDEILVRFNRGVRKKEVAVLEKKYNILKVSDKFIKKYKVLSTAAEAPLDIANLIHNEAIVSHAEPNFIIELNHFGRYENQWYLNGGYSGAMSNINIYEAWNLANYDYLENNVQIGIIDDGFEVHHPNLAGQFVKGRNFNYNRQSINDISPDSSGDYHGTACAGIAAANNLNGGIIGIGYKSKIVIAKLSKSTHLIDSVLQAIEWISDYSDVVSCSWGMPASESVHRLLYQLSVKGGRSKKGIQFVFAVGNSGKNTIAFPANCHCVLGVGANTSNNEKATYSNTGAGIDLVAPSSSEDRKIETTDLMGRRGKNPLGDYCESGNYTGFGKTSATAPMVAGVISIMLAIYPGIEPSLINFFLKDTAEKIGDVTYNKSNWHHNFGYGKINAAEAIRRTLDYANYL